MDTKLDNNKQDLRKKPLWFNWLHGADQAAAGLPALLSAADHAAKSILSGDHAHRKPGSGEKFWQFREYAEGDRPQDVDWRRSARGDRLFVRQKERQTTQTILFWCQRNRAMTYHSRPKLPRKGDHAMILTLAMAALFNDAGEMTGTLAGDVRPGRSESTRLRIAGHMFAAQTPDLPRTDDLALKLHSTVVLAGDFLAPPALIADCFDRIAARAANAIVIQVLDPAEIALPYDGRMIFENDISTLKYHIDNVESVRAAYQTRMQAQIEALDALCRRHNWARFLHRTDDAPKSTLHRIWMRAGGGS